MTIKVAINGYGRIGRNVLRAHYEGGKKHDIQIVAINDLGDAKINAHLTRYDTRTARFPAPSRSMAMRWWSTAIASRCFVQRDPAQLPWASPGRGRGDGVHGPFYDQGKGRRAPQGRRQEGRHLRPRRQGCGRHHCLRRQPPGAQARAHGDLQRLVHDQLPGSAGAAPAPEHRTGERPDDDDPFLHQRPGAHRRVSRGSAPRALGHAVDDPDQDRGGGGGRPGAARTQRALDGFAIRVPTINVSLVDLSFIAARDTTVDEVNRMLREAAGGAAARHLAYNDEPLVSVDFNHNPHSSIFDATLTKVSGRLVKVSSWYDNEWGFSNRMLDTTVALMKA
jgi:glyceraldehyde 3-phosphate dehydrogenase